MATVTSTTVAIPSFTGLKANGSTGMKLVSATTTKVSSSQLPRLSVRASLKDFGVAVVATAASAVLASNAMAIEIKLGGDDGALAFVPNEFTVGAGEKIVFKNNAGFPSFPFITTFVSTLTTFSLFHSSLSYRLRSELAMEQKVSIMRLKVDLECRKCYKKVKKVLSKYPQIRDQLYDEKNNIVTIKVVCCSPEKIRDNICYQGGSTIKSIEIVEPPKPKPAPEKPKEPEKKPEPQPGPPPPQPTKQDSAPPAAPVAKPVVMYPGTMPTSVVSYPYPSPVVPMFGPRGNPEVYYGRPIYDSYGWSGPCYMGHQHHHHCVYEEEQASVCTIS